MIDHCCLAPCKSVTNYGPLTEPKFYIVKSALTPIPTSNGHISETKRGILYPLVPKFFSRRGLSTTLSWKWPSATLSPSFGLFQSDKALFRGVPGGPRWPSLVRICPRDRFTSRKKNSLGPPYFSRPCEFCDLFRCTCTLSALHITRLVKCTLYSEAREVQS